MFNKFNQTLRKMHKGRKVSPGLETAIILIAFVTVAAVLAYTGLSAGIFSSEQGKAAVYSGLNSAQSTMSLKGSVVGAMDTTDAYLETIQFDLGLAITGTSVDMTQLVFNYWDAANSTTALDLG